MSRISAALFLPAFHRRLCMRETLTVNSSKSSAPTPVRPQFKCMTAARDFLIFLAPSGRRLRTRLVGFSMPASQGISGRVFRQGTPDLNIDVQNSSEFNREVDDRTGFVTRSMATVPIKRPDGPPIGVMQILNFAESYDHFDLEVLVVLAGQAAMALENARLAHSAQQAAMVNLIGDVSHDIKNMLTPIQTGVWTLDPLLRKTFADLQHVSAELAPEDGAKIDVATQYARESYEWILQNALDAAERVQIRTKEIADAVKGISTPARFVEANFNALCEEVVSALRLVAYDAHVNWNSISTRC
jgi:signal transduction histidine kinase